MKIVIAADKFKGSLGSVAVCNAIERGLLQASADFEITKLPLSDGGDGLIASLATYINAKKIFVTVHDPLFRSVEASYLLSDDGRTAFIEMAQASGLMLLQPQEYNPLRTSTLGTGGLIADAMQHGVSNIILGIGGSATNDCGTGMAVALGYRFLDEAGQPLQPIGENLIRIQTIDDTDKLPMDNITIEVACDVTAYLTGDAGAARLYAPQKGATPEMVERLERGVQHFALVVKQQLDVAITEIQGGGAAGGMGAGCVAFLGAKLIRGAALLLQYSGAENHIREADLIITGEGKLDVQSLQGKVVQGVAALGTKWNKPVFALCGSLDVDLILTQAAGLTAAFSIIPKPMTLEDAMAQSEALLTAAACNLGNFFKTPY
jgi:glycerate kinase